MFLCGNPKMIGVPARDKETGAVTYPQPTGVIEILEQRGFQADVSAMKFKGTFTSKNTGEGWMADVNEIIGGYRLRSLLQSGQLSQVFEVVEPTSHRHFAMKLLLPEAAVNGDHRRACSTRPKSASS